MNNYCYPIKTLELDKILLRLAKKTACEDAYNRALEITPNGDLAKVNKLLEETSSAYNLQSRIGMPPFGGLADIKLAVRMSKNGRVLSTEELLKISSVLKTFIDIIQWKDQKAFVSTCLDSFFSKIYVNKFLYKKISKAIISIDEIADEASEELASIRRRLRSTSMRIRDKLDKIIHSNVYAKYLQEPIVTIRDNRFVVPVKSEHRGSFNGLVHDTSASGSTLFIEPIAVLELNNEINVLKSNEQNEINRILQELSGLVAEVADMIYYSYETVIDLNIIFAKSELAYEMNAVVPKTNNQARLDLKKARHPLIKFSEAVPIDVSLGADFDTLIITGPNTGGKTVTLKTIGLLTLMAMCGLMIPASDGSEISVFNKIFCDIGDEQSIEQSLSTFSSHMTNIVKILGQADKESLILLDELGAGTDPVEGAALAMAILEYLKDKHSKIAATTHYAELKAFALNNEGVENACCEFDVKTLKPTYRLVIGVPGKSNAFAISKKLSMPEKIIKRANSLLSDDNRTFESVIENLEKSRQRLEKKQQELDKKLLDIRINQERIEEKERKLQKETDKQLKEAKEKAQRIISSAEANAEDMLKELSLLRKKKKSINDNEIIKLRKGLNKLQSQADPVIKKDNSGYVLPRTLQVGDRVLIVDLDKEADVLKLPDANGDVLVQAGIMKTRVALKNLRLVRTEKIKIYSRQVTKSVSNDLKTEIDLRGKKGYEAISDLEKFMDSAIYSGIKNITVIHGKGTGVLRREVGLFLKKNKNVKTFRLGNYGEGDSGVTIIELK